MFNYNKKEGFTLAETLICLVIIGVISIVMLTMAKPADKTTRFTYSNLYKGLSEGFYNAMLHRFQKPEGENHSYTTGDPFDSTLARDANSDEGADVLCRKLVEYINATSVFCSPTRLVDQKAETFLDEDIQFISNNGIKFYTSNLIQGTVGEEGKEETIRFYLVFADLNGDKGPNRLEVIKDDKDKIRIYPDIVSFALLDNGMTVPLGLPEISSRYILARLAYQEDGDLTYSKASEPYYIAKNKAWGYYQDDIIIEEPENPDDQPVGVTKEQTLAVHTYDPLIPFTMNDIIRSIIDQDSKIQIEIPRGSQISDNTRHEKCQGEQYNFADTDSCSVNLDQYVY